ncbi:MAG: hypothetical protein OEZ32_00555 [Nitrospinota bacterium]|nr:hypothetical protein [Nitrospinota bacterium]
MWLHKNDLSKEEKQVRLLYQALRNELDSYLIDYALVDSYVNTLEKGEPYPFVSMRDLKPRAKVGEMENKLMNAFIVIFTERALDSDIKKYIRFFSHNKVTKENLGELKLTGLNLADRFHAKMKYFESVRFFTLMRDLMLVDYALLIQRDTSSKSKNRFALSHFHVRVDWMIDSAAESLGKELRYISKDLYEKGDQHAQEMMEKLFEYYSFHHSASGRRTAAMLAAQFLRNSGYLSTVYVSSSESRTMTKISEDGIIKHLLIRLDNNTIEQIERHPKGDPEFARKFLIHRTKEFGVAVFQVVYVHTEHSKPPADGKMRELKPDLQWTRVRQQLLLPNKENNSVRPLSYQVVYDQQDPLS